METRADFHNLWNHLRQDGNYQPRDYRTIGGRWTPGSTTASLPN